jgi:hypothetical protein
MMQIANPQLYRELSVPFANTDLASDAIKAFIADVKAAREKHRIADVISVIYVNALSDTGDEGILKATSSFGDPLKKPIMLARALGEEQAALERAIAEHLVPKR